MDEVLRELGLPIMLLLFVAAALLWLRARRSKRRYVIIDGSNLLYWKDQVPHLDPVRAAVGALKATGARPVVWFDANAGYLVSERFLDAAVFARKLGLPPGQVHVAPKGMPADPLLLEAAELLGAQVVSNDRYRDWQDRFAFVREPGRVLRGGYENGRFVLRDERR